jgi:hypothetical protein
MYVYLYIYEYMINIDIHMYMSRFSLRDVTAKYVKAASSNQVIGMQTLANKSFQSFKAVQKCTGKIT